LRCRLCRRTIKPTSKRQSEGNHSRVATRGLNYDATITPQVTPSYLLACVPAANIVLYYLRLCIGEPHPAPDFHDLVANMATTFLPAPKVHIVMRARYTSHHDIPDSVEALVGTPKFYFLSRDSALKHLLGLLMEARSPTSEYNTVSVLDRDENGRPTAFSCSCDDMDPAAAYWVVSDVQGIFEREVHVLGYISRLTSSWG